MSDTVAPGEILRFMEESKADTKELSGRVESLHNLVSVMSGDVKRTLEQATKTNGRVNKLETFVFISKGVFLTISVLWVVVTFAVPYVRDYYTKDELTNEDFIKFKQAYEKDFVNKE